MAALCGVKLTALLLLSGLLIGIIMTTGGLIVAVMPFIPSDTLDEWNSVIDNWSTKSRPSFSQANFHLQFVASMSELNASFAELSFDPVANDQESFHDVFPELYDYMGLKLETTSSPDIPPIKNWNVTFCTTDTFNFTIMDSRKNESIGKISVPVFMKIHDDTIKDPDQCHDGFGMWDELTQTCIFSMQLLHLCVKISLNSDNVWAFDSSFGGFGCRPRSDNLHNRLTYSTSSWPITTYSLLNGTVPLDGSPVPLNPLDLQVRNAADPWIYANYISNGSLDFSQISLGYRPLGLFRGFPSFTSLVLGLLLTGLCSGLTLFLCVFPRQRRRFLYITPHEQHEEILLLHSQRTKRVTTSFSLSQFFFESYRQFRPDQKFDI